MLRKITFCIGVFLVMFHLNAAIAASATVLEIFRAHADLEKEYRQEAAAREQQYILQKEDFYSQWAGKYGKEAADILRYLDTPAGQAEAERRWEMKTPEEKAQFNQMIAVPQNMYAVPGYRDSTVINLWNPQNLAGVWGMQTTNGLEVIVLVEDRFVLNVGLYALLINGQEVQNGAYRISSDSPLVTLGNMPCYWESNGNQLKLISQTTGQGGIYQRYM